MKKDFEHEYSVFITISENIRACSDTAIKKYSRKKLETPAMESYFTKYRAPVLWGLSNFPEQIF